ncbi:NAD(P)H-flavin reductase [Desulfovibrio desulfuricans]|uniref:NAD(P)H-flavin reductase n=1 Tax=Desulfovibrio desulfuricans TaxID=876 RepID=A0AA94HQ65_DESDE|nr:NAD(P)H-flavin reductase [Desulfovibrio desulfuricans]SPD35727.1 NADH:cytochrome b5 reductase [Desulfovibrio sp. G11]
MATKKNTAQAKGGSKAAAPAAATKAAEVRTEQNAPAAAAAKTAPKAPAKGGMLREITARPQPTGNPYLPMTATVAEVIQETGNIRTLRVVLDDTETMKNFVHEPGQVGQLSVFGAGESTFVINSPPSQKDYLQFSVMQAGEVTAAIHRLSPGDKVGVRAPLGNFFPYNDWKGKDVFFVGGGIGMAPIRTIMLHVLENRKDYGKVSLLYGARTPRDMAFSYEAEEWLRRDDLDCTLCIDAPFEGWEHKVGLIPNVLTELNPDPKNCVAVLCGPPIMIKFTVQALEKLNFAPENIVTTLEKRMKCGIGICGRCNIGGRYVCVDGPVFTWKELQELPPEL